MTDTSKIKGQMDVVCSCGTRIGKVDHVDGDMLKLAKNDPTSGGKHHWVPLDWVDGVDGKTVRLNKNSEEAQAQWEEELATA